MARLKMVVGVGLEPTVFPSVPDLQSGAFATQRHPTVKKQDSLASIY